MDNCIVPYGDIIAYLRNGALIESVQHRAILYIHPVSNFNGIYIAPQHCGVPNAAVVTNGNISNYCSILGNKAVLPDFWGKTSQFFYYSHNSCFL